MTKSDYQNVAKGWRYSHPLAFDDHRRIVVLVSLAVLVIIGWLDFITGYEFGFFIFYFIPVAVASLYCVRKFGIIVAVGSAICWYYSDKFTHHPYSRAYFIYWEMFMRLVSFLTTAVTLSRIRDLVLSEERLLSELLHTRRELESYRKTENSDF